MKKMKSGFTLAEVLVALTIIGVTAALVLPTTFSSYQAKTVGVKLAKFAGQLETASRNYVANYGSFTKSSDVVKFMNKSFLTKDTFLKEGVSMDSLKALMEDSVTASQQEMAKGAAPSSNESPKPVLSDVVLRIPIVEQKHDEMPKAVALLRDGTGITVIKEKNLNFDTHKSSVDRFKVGDPVFVVKFYPNLKGLPSFAQQNFNFVVTESGYVYPHDKDNCLWNLYLNDYATSPDTYAENSACVLTATANPLSHGGTTIVLDENNNKPVDTRILVKEILHSEIKYESISQQAAMR